MMELKTFSALAQKVDSELQAKQRAEEQAEREQIRHARLERRRSRQDQAIVGGVYHPEPVDRASAMLLARAPWWAIAPRVKEEPKQEQRKMARLNEACTFGKGELGTDRRELLGDVDCTDAIVKRNGEEVFDMDKLAACFLRHIEEKYPPKVTELARGIADARSVISESTEGIGKDMADLERVMKDTKQSVRTTRMGVVSECAGVVNTLKDVRQFFLGPDYDREQKRLSEFVDLCERLKVLKDSGFLDTVADTIIRLSSYESIGKD